MWGSGVLDLRVPRSLTKRRRWDFPEWTLMWSMWATLMVNSKGLEFQAHVSMNGCSFFWGSSTGKVVTSKPIYDTKIWYLHPLARGTSTKSTVHWRCSEVASTQASSPQETRTEPRMGQEYRSIEAHLSLQCQSWKNSKLNRVSALNFRFSGAKIWQRYGIWMHMAINWALTNSCCWICSDLSRTFQAQICQWMPELRELMEGSDGNFHWWGR